MPVFEKVIHFGGKDGVKLKLERLSYPMSTAPDNTYLRLTVNEEMLSYDLYPYVRIPQQRGDNYWDLVREDIVPPGSTKEEGHIRCRILHTIQKQLSL